MASQTPPSDTFADRYTIERELGRGGTATVYLARDETSSTSVALKVLRRELVESVAADRFLREFRMNAGLRHAHITPILNSGQFGADLFLVMPHMESGSLRTRLEKERQLPIESVLEVVRAIGSALQHAHERGLIHRDVKPENILFSGGQAYLSDFGIARAVERVAGESTTSSGIVRGTPAYMSPEQASGDHRFDGRSDQYSFACVVYEMLTGMPAFHGPTQESTIAMRFRVPPREISAYRPGVSPVIEGVVQKAMSLSPADRYANVGEFVKAFDAAVTTLPGTPSRSSVWRGRRVAIALATLGVMGFGAWAIRSATSSPTLGKRDWVLVADFQGPADEKSLAPTVRDLVTAALDQSRDLGTVTRQQLNAVMRLAGVPETTHVDAELARQLAVRTSVRAIVAGSIQRIAPDRYSVALHVVSADEDRNLFSLATTATERDLVKEIGNLSRDLRSRLGEARSSIDATLPLAEVATPSFRAYQKYADAMGRASAGDVKGSNALLRDAIAIDSSFASAWAALGTNDIGMRSIDSRPADYRAEVSRAGRRCVLDRPRRARGDPVVRSVHRGTASLARRAQQPGTRSRRHRQVRRRRGRSRHGHQIEPVWSGNGANQHVQSRRRARVGGASR
jgi:serine/threonine-protein kinase